MTDSADDPRVVDLRRVGYDEWLAFIFDHEPPASGAPGDAWYWQHELHLVVDPDVQIEYLTRLLENPRLLAERHSAGQIEIGFWMMFSGKPEPFVDYLWNPAVEWKARARCIAKIPNLYASLFAADFDADGVAFMLWDLITFDYDCGNRKPESNETDRQVQGEMLEALRAQLMRGRTDMAQRAALHGLFHLKHAKGRDVIRTYLDSRQPSPELRLYAEQVGRGEGL